MEKKQKVITDIEERFSFQAPAVMDKAIGILLVEEPGYVPITWNNDRYSLKTTLGEDEQKTLDEPEK